MFVIDLDRIELGLQFYVSFSGETFNFLNCKVSRISTVMLLWKKCVTDIINVLDIILKKWRT